MNKFSRLLTIIQEGGNFGTAEEIVLKDIGGSEALKIFVNSFVKDLNKKYKSKYKEDLISDKALAKMPFSGSTKILMRPNQKIERFGKTKVGDIDLMVDRSKAKEIKEFLNSISGSTIGGAKILGGKNIRITPVKEKGINSDDIVVVEKKFGNKIVNIQFDIEYSEYEDGVPSRWANVSRSSPALDLRKGIKGLYHKELLRALTNVVGRSSIGAKNIIVVGKNGKPLKTQPKTEELSNYAFNVFAGVRTKRYKTVGNIGNKTAIQEIPTSESTFTNDLDVIYELLFNQKPSSRESKRLESFTGLTKLIDKKLDTDKKNKIAKYLLDILFGGKGAGTESQRPRAQREVTWKIFDKNVKGHGIKSKDVENKIKEYYK